MLTAEETRLIDEAAESLFYVTKNEHGVPCIDLYADYNDTNEGLLQLAYDRCKITEEDSWVLGTLQENLCRRIDTWYENTIKQMKDDIIQKAGFDLSSEKASDIQEYLWDTYSFLVPYDHYLNQHMRVNLLLGTPQEVNLDFGAIRETYDALTGQMDLDDIASVLSENTALRFLVEQQGYTMQDLQKTMDDYSQCFFDTSENTGISREARLSEFHKTHSFFLSSVCQELENTVNIMNTITILTDVSMQDFCALMEFDKELVLPKDAILGVFNPWLGGGSTLDICLEKELVLPTSMIWDVQVEDAKLRSQYSVDSVYGLIHRAWKEPLAIRDVSRSHQEKPRLGDTIQAADARRDGPSSSQIKHRPEPEK